LDFHDGLDHILQQLELEIALLISSRPTNSEFWCCWREREDAIETLIRPDDEAFVESAFERLLEIIDAH